MQKVLKLILPVFLIFSIAHAEEGMFMLNDYPVKDLKKAGLKLKPEEIYSSQKPSLSDAIVQIGGGSGSFVSPRGLVITNHHVAFRAAQELSTTENNLLENGFKSTTNAEELPASGYRARITVDMVDVTTRIRTAIQKAATPEDRIKFMEAEIKDIVAEAESADTTIRADVKRMYNGLSFILFKTREFEDIRLVYIPPRFIGEYGGDIDNWMWPRHTGDFAFFRVYAAPDGTPAAYSPDNVPYQPLHFLPISSKGVRPGNFTMIIGYPGRTQRYMTADYADFIRNTVYPNRIETFETLLSYMEACGEGNPDVQLSLQSMNKSYNNVLKNNQGMVEGFDKLHIIDKKKDDEARLQHAAETSESGAAYADITKQIALLDQTEESNWERNDDLSWLFRSSRIVSAAHTLYRWVEEQAKPDSLRDLGYMNRDLNHLLLRNRSMDRGSYVPYEKRALTYFLMRAKALPDAQSIDLVREIIRQNPNKDFAQAVSDYLDSVFKGSTLKTADAREKAFSMSMTDLLALNDPLIAMVRILEDQDKIIRNEKDNIEGRKLMLMPEYFKAVSALSSTHIYPDANSTVRLTYGTVKGYSPKDGVWYTPFTTLEGMLAKYSGEAPFNLSDAYMKVLHSPRSGKYVDKKLGDVPLNFLHTTDITGGNSGSAVMNARGEFIGTAFDGNWEAMTSDWRFDEQLTRTISVDARFILWYISEFDHADHLLDEIVIH